MRAQRLISILTCVLVLASCGTSKDEVRANKQGQSDEPSDQSKQVRKGSWHDRVIDVAGGVFLGSEKGVIF